MGMKQNLGKVVQVGGQTLREQLGQLNGGAKSPCWRLVCGASDGASRGASGVEDGEKFLEADYTFKNFSKTWNFLNKVACFAHLEKHHPTITTTYNKVKLRLTTHDLGNQISYLDLKLAQLIRDLYVREFENPEKVGSVDTLLSSSRKQFSISETSRLIDELVADARVKDAEKK